jgi:hypothetical protein
VKQAARLTASIDSRVSWVVANSRTNETTPRAGWPPGTTGAIELAALAEQLRADGIGLEFLTGELQGSHDPAGVVFAVLAALAGSEREYICDRTLEGHEAARARGKAIGGAAVTYEAVLAPPCTCAGRR